MDAKLIEMLGTCDLGEIAKAIKESQGLRGIRFLEDTWSDGNLHTIPDRDTTKTGPAMSSSGHGLDDAIKNYSNPAPQIGMTELYAKLSEQNLEGWGKMHSAMKGMGDSIVNALSVLTANATAKAEGKEDKEDKEDKKEMKSEAKDETMKAKISYLWKSLSKLVFAISKAEEEAEDIEHLAEAKRHVDEAEKEIEETEAHEKEEQANAMNKAKVSINLGWSSLAKATELARFDLHGTGNQADEAVPGDETDDRSAHDFKGFEAKSNFYLAKLNAARKAKGLKPMIIKAEDEKETKAEEKEDKKEEAKSMDGMACSTFTDEESPKMEKALGHFFRAANGEHAPINKSAYNAIRKALDDYAKAYDKADDDTKHESKKADEEEDKKKEMKSDSALLSGIDSLKNEISSLSDKMLTTQKAFQQRIEHLQEQHEKVAGHKLPPMTLVSLKSSGIASDIIANDIDKKLINAEENGLLTENEADDARAVRDMYRRVGTGTVIAKDANAYLSTKSINVRNFFESYSSEAVQ